MMGTRRKSQKFLLLVLPEKKKNWTLHAEPFIGCMGTDLGSSSFSEMHPFISSLL
jgi:hypothetical protein